MPKLNTNRVKHRIAQMDTSVEHMAEIVDIPYGSLRNAVGGRDPLSLRRVYRLAAALELPVGEVLADAEGVPDEPPPQPTQPIGPAPRKDKTTRKTAPRRARSAA